MVRWIAFSSAAIVGLALDLGTKEAIWQAKSLDHGGQINVITGWFDFVRSENQGAAFSLLWGHPNFFLTVSVIAFLAIIYFIHVSPKDLWKAPLVLGMVLAGVMGNFFDRAMFGHVRDFLRAHTPATGWAHDVCMKVFGRTEWPVFNVADCFICVGAFALIFLYWEPKKKPGDAPAPPVAPTPPAPVPAAPGGTA